MQRPGRGPRARERRGRAGDGAAVAGRRAFFSTKRKGSQAPVAMEEVVRDTAEMAGRFRRAESATAGSSLSVRIRWSPLILRSARTSEWATSHDTEAFETQRRGRSSRTSASVKVRFGSSSTLAGSERAVCF